MIRSKQEQKFLSIVFYKSLPQGCFRGYLLILLFILHAHNASEIAIINNNTNNEHFAHKIY